jgi:hypothetical protein
VLLPTENHNFIALSDEVARQNLSDCPLPPQITIFMD